jgi:hypothetical protein
MSRLWQHPLAGVRVHPPGRCRCGTELATIDAIAQLRCASCSALRGRLHPQTFDFIAEAVRLFGNPTQPVIIRRGDILW